MSTLVLLTFCLFIPSVFAKAEVWHDNQKDVDSQTYTVIFDLPPEYPYTQVKMTISYTIESNVVFNNVLDSNGNIHLNLRYLVKGTMNIEAWFYNAALQEWVFGQASSETIKRIVGVNELTIMSETQTSKEIELFRQKFEAQGINPQNGEAITDEYMTIGHSMVKLVNGELQFDNSWEIIKE